MDSIKKLSKAVLKRYHDHSPAHVFTIAISGIDASGKGYITRLLQKKLERTHLSCNVSIP